MMLYDKEMAVLPLEVDLGHKWLGGVRLYTHMHKAAFHTYQFGSWCKKE